jgi:hypothetical protein
MDAIIADCDFLVSRSNFTVCGALHRLASKTLFRREPWNLKD